MNVDCVDELGKVKLELEECGRAVWTLGLSFMRGSALAWR